MVSHGFNYNYGQSTDKEEGLRVVGETAHSLQERVGEHWRDEACWSGSQGR